MIRVVDWLTHLADDLTKFPTALVHLFIVFLLSFLHGILSSQVALADTNHYSGDTCFVGFYFAFFLPSLSLATIKVDAPDHASRRDYPLAVNKVATTGMISRLLHVGEVYRLFLAVTSPFRNDAHLPPPLLHFCLFSR